MTFYQELVAPNNEVDENDAVLASSRVALLLATQSNLETLGIDVNKVPSDSNPDTASQYASQTARITSHA